MPYQNPNTAIYLRSSKDRSDASISAQRHELTKEAESRGLIIVKEYCDVVESAKTERRPAFQDMLLDLKSPDRPWGNLLMVDTSRLSRRRYAAQAFKHECRKRGVDIIYSKLPDVDPMTSVILDAVFEAMDEVHSLMSREKGLAGMAENVRNGYRAGGRAPRGYRLKKSKPEHTGTVILLQKASSSHLTKDSKLDATSKSALRDDPVDQSGRNLVYLCLSQHLLISNGTL